MVTRTREKLTLRLSGKPTAPVSVIYEGKLQDITSLARDTYYF